VGAGRDWCGYCRRKISTAPFYPDHVLGVSGGETFLFAVAADEFGNVTGQLVDRSGLFV